MPNRNVEGDYRYGYQGEFAEKDPDTGLNAFELRMYDSRIGRWISPDPNGGCTDCSKCPDACGNLGLDAIPVGQSIDLNIDTGYFMRGDLDSSLGGAANLGTLVNVRMDGYMGQTQFWMGPDATMGEYWDKKAEAQQRLHDTNWFFLNSVVQVSSVLSSGGLSNSSGARPRQPNIRTAAVNNINKANPFSLTGTQPITASRSEFQGLVNQIKSEGIKTPILISTKNGVRYIINGHHRTYIAKRLGIQNVPIKEIPFKPEHAVIQQGKNPGYLNYIKY